jgi:hypothetical protein
VPVEIQVWEGNGWLPVASVATAGDGRFRVHRRLRPGRYRALARVEGLAPGLSGTVEVGR